MNSMNQILLIKYNKIKKIQMLMLRIKMNNKILMMNKIQTTKKLKKMRKVIAKIKTQ